MGSTVGNNMGKSFAAWSVKVDKNDPTAAEKFRVNRQGNTDPKEYFNLLNKLSKEYIALMDTDKDGAVSFDEFLKFNVDEAKQNSDITYAQIKQMTPELKKIYDKLNIFNGEGSKDKIDEREMMAFFFAMDTNNDDLKSDGFISKTEYIDTNIMLSDNSKVGQVFEKYFRTNYFELFHNYKK